MKGSVFDCGREEKKSMVYCCWEPKNIMKLRKALLSKEELLVTKERDKVCKASKRASETHEQTLHRQEQNQTHI